MSMDSDGHALLMRRLDENLKDYAAEALGIPDGDGRPMIGNLYQLQGMTEVHCLLKNQHPFTPQEVNELLKFQNPLEVAHACWEENPDRYAFDICRIIERNQFERTFAQMDPAAQTAEKPSLRDQLQTAMREARKQARTEPAPPRLGGEPR